MINLIKLNDSTIHIECEFDLALSLKEYFSFYADNYRWHPKYKAGMWDGKISLYDMRSSTMPIGLLPRLCKYLKQAGLDYCVDRDFKPLRFEATIDEEFILTFTKDVLKCDLIPRSYQIEAILKILNSNRCGILSPTGSGKSFNYFCAINLIHHFRPDYRVLMIVPNISLVEQMKFDFLDYAHNQDGYEDNIHMIYGGKSKHTHKPITISTWQSLQELPKSYFAQFDAVFCDEFHLAQAKTITSIMGNCVNAKYKVGMSGTLEDSTVKTVQLEALFGPIHRVATTRQLIKQKVLTDVKISALVLSYDQDERRLVSKMSYHDEMKFLREHEKRTNMVLRLAKNARCNSLFLFKNVEYGRLLYSRLSESQKGRKIYLVYADTPAEEREKIRSEVERDKDAIIIASYQVFSTGINIKSLQMVVFTQPSKSKIKILQSIGRAVRKHSSKAVASIIDIVDDLSTKSRKNFALKHALERLVVYDKEGFIYKVIERCVSGG